ncbi:hypothetical protein R3P38DRAFT_2473663, partial [Favolaschia claudopus]
RPNDFETLYTYDLTAQVEYPATSSTGSIGHLFQLSLCSSWFNPARTFAYSCGEPSGSTGRKTVVCDILVDSNGNKVACKESHTT